ncbi:MAG TPA: hypothetical protein VI789_01155 [Dehalococcoidia bacterium]|nr:hypothetical protein [Dehalococcoidia bacterium]
MRLEALLKAAFPGALKGDPVLLLRCVQILRELHRVQGLYDSEYMDVAPTLLRLAREHGMEYEEVARLYQLAESGGEW